MEEALPNLYKLSVATGGIFDPNQYGGSIPRYVFEDVMANGGSFLGVSEC